MSNFTENEIIPFALSIIQSHKEGIDTKNLIIHLRELMNPYGEDLEILTNRNDDKFSQKVRNLKSHKTLENKGYVKFYNDKFYITDLGSDFLIKNNNYLKDINILEEWELTTRAFKALEENGITTLSELLEWSEKDFLRIPGFGKSGINEINNCLKSLNLKLGMNLNEINKKKISNQKNNEIFRGFNEKKDINFKLLSINILEEWPLSARTHNALREENIIFLGDLISYNFEDLIKLRNFGKKSLIEIKEFLQKNKIKLDEIYFDQIKWENFLESNKNELLNKSISKNNSSQNLIGITKSLFKDYQEFKNDFFSSEKIKIDKNINSLKLEELIIEDIEYILSLLNDRSVIFFKGRYGYKENYKTLEELGKKFQITRERVRQLEKNINLTLPKLGKINKNTLIHFFSKYEFISFHKLFPKLDKYFTNTARGTEEITGDKLTTFMENYCGVEKEYFKTPERELWNFDITKLEEIFKIVPSGIEKEKFLELIEENYGYNKFVSLSALEFMETKEIIKIENQKVYTLKLNRISEVCNILLDYPDGLHWKKICEIGNQSFSKNKWNPERNVADYSMNMIHNEDIYLSERGTIKLFKFCSETQNKDEIIDFFINYLKVNNKNEIAMETVYKEIIKIDKFENLNFYDARAVIKKFGSEKGIYHSGPSGTNTISFDKDVKRISLKDKIIEIINNSEAEIHAKEIKKQLQKTNEDLPLEVHLNSLVEEMLIFRMSPGTYLSYEQSIKLCNFEEIRNLLNKILKKFEFITIGYARENMNENLFYNFSNYFYRCVIRVLSKNESWFIDSNYISSKNKKNDELSVYVKKNYNWLYSSKENFENISRKIGLTKIDFSNIIYKPDFKINSEV